MPFVPDRNNSQDLALIQRADVFFLEAWAAWPWSDVPITQLGRVFMESGRERAMKFGFIAFLVFLGGVFFLLSFVADRQAKLGDDRVARKMSHSVIDARIASERSPYMRTER